jgi:uracil-DNA glycosylase
MEFCIIDEIISIQNDWSDILLQVAEPYTNLIEQQLQDDEEKEHMIFPSKGLIFNAFKQCPINNVKVVIIGQDCYYSRARNKEILANGLCFSVDSKCNKCPPSLRTIFDELKHEYGGDRRTNTDLSDWARQGVLLLNCALTVREGKAGSHMKIWRGFTEEIIKYIAKNHKYIVYILWGEFAKAYSKYIDKNDNLILECRHPSGLAASKGPFIGNNHFKSANEYLSQYGKDGIMWI